MLYDFGPYQISTDKNELDKMKGRQYEPFEYCTDVNQVYAAKVNRVCRLKDNGTRSNINRCTLPDGNFAKEGDKDVMYSRKYCEKTTKASCTGKVVRLMHGKVFLVANRNSQSPHHIRVPLPRTTGDISGFKTSLFH